MSIPGGKFEPEMVSRREVVFKVAREVYCKKCCSDNYVESVESSSDKEDRSVNAVCNSKWCVFIFLKLYIGKCDTKQNCSDKAMQCVAAAGLEECMVGSGYGKSGSKEKGCVK